MFLSWQKTNEEKHLASYLKIMCVWHISGVSWNQHCDDQHRPAATGLLQLRWGALQVLVLNKPKAFLSPASATLFCPCLVCYALFLFPGQTRTIPTCRSAGTWTQVCVAPSVLVTWQRSRVRPGEELLASPFSHTPFVCLFSCYTQFSCVVVKVLIFIPLVSGSVWSSYRKSCVNTVMKWLVPESSSRYINRMTNEALHKGEFNPGFQ